MSGRLHPRRAQVPAALACAGLLAWALGGWPFTVDDAFIVARYGRRLASGLGWTFRDGPPTDGVTGPLWVLPAALGALLEPAWREASILVPKIVGGASALLAAGLALRVAAGRAGRAALPVGAFLAVQAQLGIWAVAGLETGAATLGLMAAVVAARARRGGALGLALGALAWLRPELLAAGGVLALMVPVAVRARALGVALVLGLGLVAFRVALFGSPLPLAVGAKVAGASPDLAYVARGLMAMTGGAGLFLVGVAANRGRRGDRALAAALGAQVLVVAALGGDWMPGFRLLVPLLPLLALLQGEGVMALFRARRPRLALALAGLAVLLPLVHGAVQVPAAREAGAARERMLRPLARELAAAGSVGLVDVGFLGWASGADVLDLGGVTDPDVGRARGGHLDKRIPVGLLSARSPALIVLHAARPPRIEDGQLRELRGFPVERRLAASRWLRRHYRVRSVVRLGPDYHYVVLARRVP